MSRSYTIFFARPLFLLLIAGFSALLSASPKPTDNESLKLVTGPHYPPFAADYLPDYGLAPFLIAKIFESGGKTVTVDLLPWKRAYRNTRKGEYDAVLPFIESKERHEDYFFSHPVFKLDAFVYVKSDSDIHGQSLGALNGLEYCNPVGFSDGEVLERLRQNGDITRITPASLNNCFSMLIAGRVDFVKINEQVAEYLLDKMELSGDAVRRLPFVVEQTALHLLVPRTRRNAADLIQEFNVLFTEMERSGQIELLKARYLEQLQTGQQRNQRGEFVDSKN